MYIKYMRSIAPVYLLFRRSYEVCRSNSYRRSFAARRGGWLVGIAIDRRTVNTDDAEHVSTTDVCVLSLIVVIKNIFLVSFHLAGR